MTRLDLIVGPNGAGKSTFVEFILAGHRPRVPFVNADIIAAERWPEDPVARGHDAARAAAEVRQAMIERGEPFIAGTVASHESKIDLVRDARAAGYHVHLVVILVPEKLAVARVRARVDAGGHDVPEVRIRGRYKRLWRNVTEMIELADSAEVFNNAGVGPRTVAVFAEGDIVGQARWPAWTPSVLTERWPAP